MFTRILDRVQRKARSEEIAGPPDGRTLASVGSSTYSGHGLRSDTAVVSERQRNGANRARQEESETHRESKIRSKKVETKFHSNSRRNFQCLGEVAVESSLTPREVIRVYQALKDSPNTEVLYVHPNARGTTIVCGSYDVASFLTSLDKTPNIAAWVLSCK